VDGQEEHQRRASRLLTFTISEFRFPIERQKPLEQSGGFFIFKDFATAEKLSHAMGAKWAEVLSVGN
jgi:hypothetical protein